MQYLVDPEFQGLHSSFIVLSMAIIDFLLVEKVDAFGTSDSMLMEAVGAFRHGIVCGVDDAGGIVLKVTR